MGLSIFRIRWVLVRVLMHRSRGLGHQPRKNKMRQRPRSIIGTHVWFLPCMGPTYTVQTEVVGFRILNLRSLRCALSDAQNPQNDGVSQGDPRKLAVALMGGRQSAGKPEVLVQAPATCNKHGFDMFVSFRGSSSSQKKTRSKRTSVWCFQHGKLHMHKGTRLFSHGPNSFGSEVSELQVSLS